jgi:putative ABC transport system permease protein
VLFGRSSANNGVKIDPKQNLSSLTAATYFGENAMETLGVQLESGRLLRLDEFRDMRDLIKALEAGDLTSMPHSVLITRAMADKLWPGQQALGKSLYIGEDVPLTVVGVLKDLVRPEIWEESAGHYSMVLPVRVASGKYLIRTATPEDRQRVLDAAVAKLRQINPNRVVLRRFTVDELRAKFFENDRAMTSLLISVCVALLVVTALGIVGLGSFWVAQRRRQIGVRRALGATRQNILRYFQTENFLLATIGIVLGMVLAYGINLFLMLRYELPRLPAIYFPVGALALWLIGQAAVLGPALRAAAVPPVVATRSV